jgi:tetratricopeptide (TPR) repeat protein
MQDQRDKAVEVLQQGITEDPKSSQLIRRGLADLHIEKFRADNEALIRTAMTATPNVELPDDGLGGTEDASNEVDWSNLQAAAKFDRDNPTVGQEIAMQWRRLTMPPADLLEVLRHQLKEDIATTGARLMIAELYLIKGRVEDAKIQWETILKKEPNVIAALNNLSVILSRETPPKLSLAIELIDRANRINPLNAEICDTYGEVYMNAGRPMDAIAKLEEAIRIDPKRIPTRKRLAACYREIGMNDMAGEQIIQIKRLEDERNRQAVESDSPKPEPPKVDGETPNKESDAAGKPPASAENAPETAEKASETSKKKSGATQKKPDASKKSSKTKS